MKKKRQWYTMDDHPCIVVKKGKTRFIIDVTTGNTVLHNPIPLAALAAKVIGSSLLRKAATTAATTAALSYVGKKVFGKKENSEDTQPIQKIQTDSLDVANPPKSAWMIREALKN